MTDPRKPVFDALRVLHGPLSEALVADLGSVLDKHEVKAAGSATPPPAAAASGGLRPSPRAFAIITAFEGYARALPDGRCRAYPDPASGGAPWTIGFGSTGPDVKPGTVWTRAEAEARLEADVIKFAGSVGRLIDGAPTSQAEFDAMVSLSYNVGIGNFSGSTLLRRHKAGDKAGAAAEFHKWNKASGMTLPGLTRRREAEARLYRGQP